MARTKGRLRSSLSRATQDQASNDVNDNATSGSTSQSSSGEFQALRRQPPRNLRQRQQPDHETRSMSSEPEPQDNEAQTDPNYMPRPTTSGSVDSSGSGSARSARSTTTRHHGISTDPAPSRFVIDWVKQNYQYEPDHNVPRRGMYEHYRSACARCNMPAVNSATFGKLLRHVLPEISTRRLGTRGQSKYHYCGIKRRTSPSAPPPLTGPEAEPPPSTRPLLPPTAPMERATRPVTQQSPAIGSFPPSAHPMAFPSSSVQYPRDSRSFSRMPMQQPQPYPVYEPSVADVRLPSFVPPLIPAHEQRYNDTNELVTEFAHLYEQHCQELLTLIKTGNLDSIYGCLYKFYQTMPERFRRLIYENIQVTEAIWRWDCALYDAIIISLLPTVYAPLSLEAMKGLRQYTRQLEGYISESLKDYPQILFQRKSDVAHIFVSKFRRHLKLNQMAQTASALLRRPDDLDAMRADWETVDFGAIIDQGRWVCDCDTNEIGQILHHDVWNLLRSGADIDRWVAWIQSILDKFLGGRPDQRTAERGRFSLIAAKQFVLNWTFYTSLVMKDLLVANAQSLSHFRILHLFFDDLMLYLVEERIANSNIALSNRSPSGDRSGSGPPQSQMLETPPQTSSTTRKEASKDIQQEPQLATVS